MSCQVSGVARAGTQINSSIDFDWWPKCCFVWAGRRTRTTKSFRYTSCSITKRSKQHASGWWKFPSAQTSQVQTDIDTRNFTGAKRNVIKLVNLLSLCHLFVVFTKTASVNLTAFFFCPFFEQGLFSAGPSSVSCTHPKSITHKLCSHDHWNCAEPIYVNKNWWWKWLDLENLKYDENVLTLRWFSKRIYRESVVVTVFMHLQVSKGHGESHATSSLTSKKITC